jgi:hypothetical protein
MCSALFLLTGCKKEPGLGGKTEIRGYVLRQNVSQGGVPIGAAYPYPEARVYIVYGDHDFYDDDVRTGPDGLFVFSWLREGDYKVYTFGECTGTTNGCNNGLTAVYATAKASGDETVVNVGNLTAANY